MCGAFRGHEVWSTKVVFLGEDLAGGWSLDIDRRELQLIEVAHLGRL